MKNFFIVSLIPIMILSIIIVGVKEKRDVFNLFLDGIKKGVKIVISIFPFILAIMIAINLFKNSGMLDIITMPIMPILQKLGIPKEIIPLCILRPLSGSSSMSIVLDIFKNYGPDSKISKMASIIMAGTETTLYCTAILLGSVKIKKTRGILIAGIIADITTIAIAITTVNLNLI